MSRHRYVKDYRLNEYIAENGRVTSESEYIGGDYRFAAGAALLARRSAEPLKHDVADKIGHAAPAAALWATLLPGAGFLGCLISSLAGAGGWDALFLAVSAVMTVCAAACFAIRRDFYTEKR